MIIVAVVAALAASVVVGGVAVIGCVAVVGGVVVAGCGGKGIGVGGGVLLGCCFGEVHCHLLMDQCLRKRTRRVAL